MGSVALETYKGEDVTGTDVCCSSGHRVGEWFAYVYPRLLPHDTTDVFGGRALFEDTVIASAVADGQYVVALLDVSHLFHMRRLALSLPLGTSSPDFFLCGGSSSKLCGTK